MPPARILLPLFLLLAATMMGQSRPASRPAVVTSPPATAPMTTLPKIDFSGATADLKARGAWLHAEVKRLAEIVAGKPDAPRPMLKSRNGQTAKDPRPTPAQAITAARESEQRVDRAVTTAINTLAEVKADKAQFGRNVMLARIYVNEFVELTLIQLKDSDEPVNTPAWISAATQMTAAASAAVDTKLHEAIFEAWATSDMKGATGLGKAGEGGKESVFSVSQGKPIAGFGDVVSGRVSFRINENNGKPIVTPTTPNFSILMTGAATFGSTELADKSLLEHRLSLWYARAPVPDINAADPTLTPASAPAPAKTK